MSYKLVKEWIINNNDVSCLLRLGLFLLICKASLSLRSMGLLAVPRIIKQEGVYKLLQEGDLKNCLKIYVLIVHSHCVLFNPCRKMATGFTNIAGKYIPHNWINILLGI